MEMIDVYDENMQPTGVEEKNRIHQQGLWHKTFRCWVFSDVGNVVFQLRSGNQSTNAAKLDVAVIGHIQAGEKVLEAGVREIKEQIGLDIDGKELMFLGVIKISNNSKFKDGSPLINREFTYNFLLKRNVALNTYKLQKDRLAGIFNIKLDDGLELFGEKTKEINSKGFMLDKEKMETFQRKITVKDFVGHSKTYYTTILGAIKKYLAMQANGDKQQ